MYTYIYIDLTEFLKHDLQDENYLGIVGPKGIFVCVCDLIGYSNRIVISKTDPSEYLGQHVAVQCLTAGRRLKKYLKMNQWKVSGSRKWMDMGEHESYVPYVLYNPVFRSGRNSDDTIWVLNHLWLWLWGSDDIIFIGPCGHNRVPNRSTWVNLIPHPHLPWYLHWYYCFCFMSFVHDIFIPMHHPSRISIQDTLRSKISCKSYQNWMPYS